MSDDEYEAVGQPKYDAQPEGEGEGEVDDDPNRSGQSKLWQLLLRAARGLAVPLASYYTGHSREEPSDEDGEQSGLGPTERALLGAALVKLVRELNSLGGKTKLEHSPMTEANQPIGLMELVGLARLARGVASDEPEVDESDPVAREIALRRQLAETRRDRLTQLAERTAEASWTPPTAAARAPVSAVPMTPPIAASHGRARDPGRRITQPLRFSRSSASSLEASMSSKTLSFSSGRRSQPDPQDDDIWPAPMAGGPPLIRSRTSSGRDCTSSSSKPNNQAGRGQTLIGPAVRGSCCGSRAPMTCAPTTTPVVITNSDGSCSPNPFKVSCETRLGLVNCFKRVICELLWCLEETLCVDGRFDFRNIDSNQLLDCLSVALCSAIRCIPEVLCPTPPDYPQLCATPCDDGFAVEESLR